MGRESGAKLAIPSHSKPIWWEEIGKVANWAKLAIRSEWWKNIRKVANRAKLAILTHSEPLRWEKRGVANRAEPFQVILSLVGKDWKSCESGEIGHSKSF